MQEQRVEHVPADAAGSLPDPGDRRARRPLPAPTLVPGGLSGGKLHRVADHIDANLGGELRLGELSSVVHMSPFHFARLFKLTAGVAPHRFVVRRRIDRAIELLAGGELPIGEIDPPGRGAGGGFAPPGRPGRRKRWWAQTGTGSTGSPCGSPAINKMRSRSRRTRCGPHACKIDTFRGAAAFGS